MQEGLSASFENTALWLDVKQIIESKDNITNQVKRLRIHTKETDFDVWKIIEIQENHDYVADTAGSLIVRFLIGLGDYTYKLYPFRDMLEATLKTEPMNQQTGFDTESSSPTVRYRAILDMKYNKALTGDRISNQDYETLNQVDVVEVRLELQDRNLEVIRSSILEGGCFRQITGEKLLTSVMMTKANQFIIDGKPSIECFNIVKPDNTEYMGTVNIPSGVKTMLLPTFIQERGLGIYKTGLGTHYQRFNDKPSMFVYSLYDTSRFDEDVERVVFFAVPQDKLSGVDKTWRKEGKVLYVACTGSQQYNDDSQLGDLNRGVGFRMTDARSMQGRPGIIRDSEVLADRARLNTEIGTRNRQDGIYYAPVAEASANPFKMYSQVAARQVSQTNLVWENSAPDLLYPGMPCKYVFLDQGDYREIKGTVLGKYSVTAVIGAPVTSEVYKTSTHVGMCLEYYDKSPLQPKATSPGIF